MSPFGFPQIIGMCSWAFLIVGLLTLAGFFALPVLLFVGAVYALSLFFGRT